jgi:flagellar biosynthesis/type III secretory pathway M-ring protein FliF/YscJ
MDDETTWVINEDHSVSAVVDGETVYRSRPFRLLAQAERHIDELVKQAAGEEGSTGITLEVQNLSIDPDTIFRRLHHG